LNGEAPELIEMNTPTVNELAKMIDHSLLHPTMSDAEVKAGCELARDYGCATACVKPYSIRQALEIFAGTDVMACAVIGFPHGNSTTGIKVVEAEAAALAGAREIDMVVNIGKVKGGDWDYVKREVDLINQAVVAAGSILKVIFENDYLANDEIIRLCEICSEVNVAFVKTSTGYGFVKQDNGMYSYKGATHEHLKLMRKHTAPHIQIKAAGGVRTLDEMLAVRELGVTRIGASATRAILDEAIQRGFPGSLPNPHSQAACAAAPAGY
jgi:deoxyribose-phosphate aldolase